MQNGISHGGLADMQVPSRRLIGKHGEGQVLLGPIFLVVMDWPQAQFRLQAAENSLQIGQLGVGLSQRGRSMTCATPSRR